MFNTVDGIRTVKLLYWKSPRSQLSHNTVLGHNRWPLKAEIHFKACSSSSINLQVFSVKWFSGRYWVFIADKNERKGIGIWVFCKTFARPLLLATALSRIESGLTKKSKWKIFLFAKSWKEFSWEKLNKKAFLVSLAKSLLTFEPSKVTAYVGQEAEIKIRQPDLALIFTLWIKILIGYIFILLQWMG